MPFQKSNGPGPRRRPEAARGGAIIATPPAPHRMTPDSRAFVHVGADPDADPSTTSSILPPDLWRAGARTGLKRRLHGPKRGERRLRSLPTPSTASFPGWAQLPCAQFIDLPAPSPPCRARDIRDLTRRASCSPAAIRAPLFLAPQGADHAPRSHRPGPRSRPLSRPLEPVPPISLPSRRPSVNTPGDMWEFSFPP